MSVGNYAMVRYWFSWTWLTPYSSEDSLGKFDNHLAQLAVPHCVDEGRRSLPFGYVKDSNS